MMALELSLELLYLRNILRHGRTEKILVIPLGVLFDLIRRSFDLAVTLRLAKVIKVVAVTLFIVLNTEQVVEGSLGKGDRLIHRIEVVWIHGSHELANQMKTSRVGQSRALISQDFFSLIAVVVRLGTKRYKFFRIFHPFNLCVFVGAADKSDGIAGGVLTMEQDLNYFLLRKVASVGHSVTEKVTSDRLSLSPENRFLQLFQGWGRARGPLTKYLVNLAVGFGEKGLGIASLSSQNDLGASVEKLHLDLVKGYVRQYFHHFLETVLCFLPARVLLFRDGVNRVRSTLHRSTVVDDKVKTFKLRQHEKLVGKSKRHFIFGKNSTKFIHHFVRIHACFQTNFWFLHHFNRSVCGFGQGHVLP
mmetsp:Transcript_9435/g.18048  ORF Transcript_9435/g.18048 Transcript_9435/m.18048 type:complete len:361 (+) Transcript_9435:123-1205(+)